MGSKEEGDLVKSDGFLVLFMFDADIPVVRKKGKPPKQQIPYSAGL